MNMCSDLPEHAVALGIVIGDPGAKTLQAHAFVSTEGKHRLSSFV